MAQGVWTIAEQRDGEIRKITYEVVSEGRRLADALGQELTVVLLGSNIKDKAAELGHYGARLSAITAFSPPKAKAFDSTAETRASRASFGTTSSGQSGSGAS